MTIKSGRLAACWAILFVIAIVAVGVFMVSAATHPKTVTVYEPQPALTSSSRAAEAAERLGTPGQSVPGAQINPQLEGLTCDAYPLADGLLLLCHP